MPEVQTQPTKQDLEAVLKHLIRIRCELGNLEYVLEQEDYHAMLAEAAMCLRYSAVILEHRIGEVAP